MSWTAFTAVIAAIWKPVLLPVVTWFVGWLLPSPLQKAASGQANIHNAESQASSSRGNTTGLDNLP